MKNSLTTAIITLTLLNIIHCDLAIFTGSLSPTGGVKMTEKKYKLYYSVDILEDYPFINEYYIQLSFSHSGYNSVSGMTDSNVIVTMPGKPKEEHKNKVQGGDNGRSFFISRPTHSFVKDSKIEIFVNDIVFPRNGHEKDLIVTAGILHRVDNVAKFLLYNRLRLPFHPYSFVASSEDKKTITTRFVSSIGHHESAFFSFKYPSCVTLNRLSGPLSCNQVPWIVPEAGIDSSVMCESNNNELKITKINRDYSSSKSQTTRFLISLPTAHTCKDDDVAEIKVVEGIGMHTLETGFLFGFNERPISESDAKKDEEQNNKSDGKGLDLRKNSISIGVVTLFLAIIILIA